ncbi:hypothetical protein NC652_014274 [Populus alba x Populus x berolinensis]|nr:hypothetical protein NC651_013902 [Populus alba x Populus x berolinensis]KAJ6930693.1 hypothetical protein NC652_014274 [Populus alba x Populus x berolinensis]
MSIAKPLKKAVAAVILDLDDGILGDVLKALLLKYGKQWDGREAQKIVGKTPLEEAAIVVGDYELPCSIDEFVTQITPLLYDQ